MLVNNVYMSLLAIFICFCCSVFKSRLFYCRFLLLLFLRFSVLYFSCSRRCCYCYNEFSVFCCLSCNCCCSLCCLLCSCLCCVITIFGCLLLVVFVMSFSFTISFLFVCCCCCCC